MNNEQRDFGDETIIKPKEDMDLEYSPIINNIFEPFLNIKLKKLHKDTKTPLFCHKTDTGADLYSCKDTQWEPVYCSGVKIGYSAKVPTGIAIEFPEGIDGQVRPRSGLASKHITVKNSPGTLDESYRGEVIILLECFGDLPNDEALNPIIKKHIRVAQLVFHHRTNVKFEEVEELNQTERGNKGFGSSGLK